MAGRRGKQISATAVARKLLTRVSAARSPDGTIMAPATPPLAPEAWM